MKRRITVPVSNELEFPKVVSKIRVRAEIVGLFAIHGSIVHKNFKPRISRELFTVTHLLTRWSVYRYFTSKDNARRAVRYIKDKINWDFTDPLMPQATSKDISKIRRLIELANR